VLASDAVDVRAADASYLPCPICNGVEGCDHPYPERAQAARVGGATVTDDLLVSLFYAAQGDITKFRLKGRALLEQSK
jgi:hypothetical protein